VLALALNLPDFAAQANDNRWFSPPVDFWSVISAPKIHSIQMLCWTKKHFYCTLKILVSSDTKK